MSVLDAKADWRALPGRLEQWLLADKRVSYGIAGVRIGFGLILAVSLLVDFRHRHLAWGAGRDWAQVRVDTDLWPDFLNGLFGYGQAPWVFELQYLVLIVLSVLMVLGYRARVVVPLVLIGYIGLTRANPFISDGGVHLFRIALLYLCFADTSRRWSLDARRRAKRRGKPKQPLVPEWLPNLLHNAAVVLLAYQMIVIYIASSMYKIQGNLWYEGVAVYYVFQLEEYAAWPEITDILSPMSLLIGILTYATIYIQLFFPFLLLNRWTRRMALIAVTGMHLGIGLFMGLMHFSLIMIAIDAVFIRESTYRTFTRWLLRTAAKHWPSWMPFDAPEPPPETKAKPELDPDPVRS